MLIIPIILSKGYNIALHQIRDQETGIRFADNRFEIKALGRRLTPIPECGIPLPRRQAYRCDAQSDFSDAL